MSVLDNYNIDLNDVRSDAVDYRFDLDRQFFDALESTLLRGGNVAVDLKVKKNGGAYAFVFRINGMVQVPCDRCLDDMDFMIETERELTVKVGEEYSDEGDIIILPCDKAVLNVAWIIYEFIALEVPLTHVHEPGHCNAEMAEMLAAHLVTSPEEGEFSDDGDRGQENDGKPSDSRWDKLREILDNN